MSSLLDLVSTFVLNGSRIAIAGGSYHPRISDNYAVLQRTYGSDCECDCDCKKEDDKAQEYLEALQRLQAEFENYRKRNELFAIKAKEEGIILSIEKLLPVLDSFNLAESHLTKDEFKGLSLIKEQLQTFLKQLGVTKIEAKGEIFDPNFHNAILVGEDKTKKSQVVLEVLQEGYMLKDRVIRHSVVKINS